MYYDRMQLYEQLKMKEHAQNDVKRILEADPYYFDE